MQPHRRTEGIQRSLPKSIRVPRRQRNHQYRTLFVSALVASLVVVNVSFLNSDSFGAAIRDYNPAAYYKSQQQRHLPADDHERHGGSHAPRTRLSPREVRERTTTTNRAKRPFLRYDAAGWFDSSTLARSHWLPSIPKARSFPRDMAENLTYHIQQRTNTSQPKLKSVEGTRGKRKEPNPEYDLTQDFRKLYLYNPSIVPVSGERKTLAHLSSLLFKSVHYVATFRAYLGSNCFGPSKERPIMKAGEQVNYLGIALLNEELQVLSDIVVDMNEGPLPKEVSFYWKTFRQPVEDCRVFDVNDGLRLVCNNILFAIRLQDPVLQSGSEEPFHVYPNVYGGKNFQLALTEEPRVIVEKKEAKNMNIFCHRPTTNDIASPATTGEHYVQIYPLRHWYRNLDSQTPAIQAPNDFLPTPSFDTPDKNRTIRASQHDLGRGSNKTVDEQPFFPDTGDRGTACCIEVTLEDSSVVLVGITHTKLGGMRNSFWRMDELHRYDNATHTYGWNRYLSRFVAYQLDPPFSVVARSGWFCLPFGASEAENSADGNALAGFNEQYKLDLFDDSFACPAIHFPSTISETSNDNSKAIIGYGINDCYPRMMVVEKLEIARKLQPPNLTG